MPIIKIFEEFWKKYDSSNEDDDFLSELNIESERILGNEWESVSEFFKRFNYFISLFETGVGKNFSYLAREKDSFGFAQTSTTEYVQVEIDKNLIEAKLEWNEIIKHKENIFKCLDLYDSLCGLVDIILWRLDNQYNLGGWDKEWVRSDDGKIDAVIKYHYGYHNSTYGSLYIDSMYGNINNFIFDVGHTILKHFLERNRPVNNIDEVLSELEKEPCVRQSKDSTFIVYFEDFYQIILPNLIGKGQHDTSIETIGNFFINYLLNIGVNEDNIDVEKDWSYIEIKFLD